MKRKKVVYLTRTLQVGGAERYLIETAIGLNRERFAPQIYCISGPGALKTLAEEHGIPVAVFDAPPCQSLRHWNQHLYWRLRKFGALYHYLRREQPDIIHTYSYTPSVYGGLAARISGKAVLLTNRMCLGNFKDQKPYYQLLENLINHLAHGILVNSQALQRDVLRREKVKAAKVYVVYGGVDVDVYAPGQGNSQEAATRSAKKRELGIPDEDAVVAMLANLRPCKGYREFIQAAASIRQRYPETRFLCIGGDRGIQGELEQLRKDLGLEEHVIFTGEVQRVEKLFPIVDIQVSASYEEGFSSAIIEGMACGKPVVATDVGGSAEAVAHEHTGLLVPPHNAGAIAEAVIRMLANPQWAADLGRNGRERVVERFSTNAMIASLEAIYLQLCDRG